MTYSIFGISLHSFPVTPEWHSADDLDDALGLAKDLMERGAVRVVVILGKPEDYPNAKADVGP